MELTDDSSKKKKKKQNSGLISKYMQKKFSICKCFVTLLVIWHILGKWAVKYMMPALNISILFKCYSSPLFSKAIFFSARK